MRRGLLLCGLILLTAACAPPPASAAASAPLIVPPRTPTPVPTPYYLPSPTPRPGALLFQPTALPAFQLPLLHWQIIGYSVLGRPLEVHRFGNGHIPRLIVAGIHGGNEWNTIALADELIAALRADPGLVPEDITLYILRNLNPDGEARAHGPDGRANANGVDLNRNWPESWQATWDRDGCWDLRPISAGTHPASEPETMALMEFIRRQNIEALISYHSAALGIFAGGVPPDAASLRLAEAVAAVSDYPWPPVDTGCHYTGNLTDWASAQGIAAIDIELTDHTHTDLEQNLRILQVFLAWRR